VDSGGPDGQRRAVALLPEGRTLRWLGRGESKMTIWEDWADDGVILEFKREAKEYPSCGVYFTEIKDEKSKGMLTNCLGVDVRVLNLTAYLLSICCPIPLI